MKRAILFFVAALGAASCAGSQEQVSVARYSGEPNGDDAALIGQLAVDTNNCLVLEHRDGSATLLAVASAVSHWDDEARTLTVSGTRFGIGDEIVLGGSGRSLGRGTALRWSISPKSECTADREWIWFAGDGGSFLKDVPGLWTPTPLPPGAPTPTPPRTLTYREALEEDAARYAEQSGVTLEEAIAILERQVPPPPPSAR
jgi:hypothetical protein